MKLFFGAPSGDRGPFRFLKGSMDWGPRANGVGGARAERSAFRPKRAAAALMCALLLAAASPGVTSAADEEIVVGSILPLTGALAPTGAGLKAAQELARDLVNGKAHYPVIMTGTLGLPNLNHRKLKIIFADSQGNPEQAKTVAEQLITQDHVVALLGCYSSATTQTASQVAERYGVPFLNPDSSNPSLSDRGFKWFFRSTPHDGIFAQNFFDFLSDMKKKKNATVKTIAIVHENTLFGTGLGDAMENVGKKEGYTIGLRLPYPATTSEVQSEVQKIKAANPDAIMMASYLGDAILYMKTFKEQGINPQAILAQDAGFVDPGFLKAVGKDGDYIFSREVYSSHIKYRNQGVPLIDQLFGLRFNGAHLDGNSARDFMGVLILADAINRAKSTTPEAIRLALHQTKIPGGWTIMPWHGVSFDQRGQNVEGNGIIVQIQNGIYETVWPFDVASKAPMWPMPPWNKR